MPGVEKQASLNRCVSFESIIQVTRPLLAANNYAESESEKSNPVVFPKKMDGLLIFRVIIYLAKIVYSFWCGCFPIT
jgi:hypothetical protein